MLEESVVAPSVLAAQSASTVTEDPRLVTAKLYQSVFSRPEGKKVLADLKEKVTRAKTRMGINDKTGMTDPMLTAYRLGQYELLEYMLSQIMIASEFANVGKPVVDVHEMSTFEMMQNIGGVQ